MHPNRAFGFADDYAMRNFVASRSLAHLFVHAPEGPMVAHVPLARAIADQ